MKRLKNFSLLLFMGLFIVACDNDDSLNPVTDPILDNIRYDLGELNDSGVSGDAVFNEQENGSIQLIVEVEGTSAGNMHPTHIHMNNALEDGDIIVSLEPVDGETGLSITTFSALDDGTPISFEDIEGLDAYINVHLSANDDTVVAQGDIGENAFTGDEKSFDLEERDAPGISGSILFQERENGEALATISLENTPAGGMHPAHIHMNTAAEGGDIIYTFTPVNGDTGMSQSNVAALDDDTEFGYADVLEVDGYVNVHLSADDLGTIVAQGDIGQNEFTGESKSYDLGERAIPGINGSILFEERVNGFALATISLENTPDDGEHPAHIHMNTVAEGGDIIFTFTPVDGSTGMSVTETDDSAEDGEDTFTYSDILEIDGYVNVHLSANELGTIVAQGDIGQNELTGESITYTLNEVDVPGINGDVTFEERVNGEALATLNIANTIPGEEHPAHIHANSASEGGDIIYTFAPVNGDTGMSQSNVSALDDDTEFGYADVLEVNGYVNVHLGPGDDLATIVAQGDIGSNF